MSRKIAALAACAMLACAPEAAREETPPPAAAAAVSAQDQRTILFLGTSLTAGYGVGVENSFPSIIQSKIDSAALPYRIVNAGLSGETSAGGLRRLEWSLQQAVHLLVLELGANDGLRGLPVEQLRANLDSIMARTRARYPDVAILIAGMEAPPNLGTAYTTSFRETFSDLADKYDAELIPFLLEGVAALPAMNQEDGIHPSIEGHKRVAENIWKVLNPMLRQLSGTPASATRE